MKEQSCISGLSVFTIGHSNHSDTTFLELLKKQGVQTLVDVRSSPYAKYTPHFNRDIIANLLASVNIDYEYYGSLLGGKPSEPEYYDSENHVLYGKIAESERFQEGIDRLVQLLKYSVVAIVCAEEDPTECHRRLLIGRVLQERGIEVLHIRGDGSVHGEEELTKAEDLKKNKGQLGMFGQDEEKEWKSTRSVSPKSPQKNSSRPSERIEYDY